MIILIRCYKGNDENGRINVIGTLVNTPLGPGNIDAEAVHPDGLQIFRVNDHWWPLAILNT